MKWWSADHAKWWIRGSVVLLVSRSLSPPPPTPQQSRRLALDSCLLKPPQSWWRPAVGTGLSCVSFLTYPVGTVLSCVVPYVPCGHSSQLCRSLRTLWAQLSAVSFLRYTVDTVLSSVSFLTYTVGTVLSCVVPYIHCGHCSQLCVVPYVHCGHCSQLCVVPYAVLHVLSSAPCPSQATFEYGIQFCEKWWRS